MMQTNSKTPRGDREAFQVASGDTMKAIVYIQYPANLCTCAVLGSPHDNVFLQLPNMGLTLSLSP